MPMSDLRHPSRDALLRDALGQIKEQRGVSCERFARVLNGLAHSMCPAKAEDMPCLSSFTEVSEEYDLAIMSWNKRVQRWSSGAVEFPAWLEEPWVTALEELGDSDTRVMLARRHGFLGVRRPEGNGSPACAFSALGLIINETGKAVCCCASMVDKGDVVVTDSESALCALREIDDAVAALLSMRSLIEQRVKKPALKAVGQ